MTTEEKLIYAKNVLGWTATKNGEVFNKKGKKIGTIDSTGYYCSSFRIEGKAVSIRLHQYIFWFFNNYLPKTIDHIDRNKLDNKIENLRDISQQLNMFNMKRTGYSYNKKSKKWRARIAVSYKRIWLGSFDTEQEAKEAYLEAKKIYHKI